MHSEDIRFIFVLRFLRLIYYQNVSLLLVTATKIRDVKAVVP